MKRITRLDVFKNRVWLTQTGHWTRDEGQAFVFDNADAEKRLRRLPHAKAEDPPVVTASATRREDGMMEVIVPSGTE